METVPKAGDTLLPVTGTSVTSLADIDVITVALQHLTDPSDQSKSALSPFYALTRQGAEALAQQILAALQHMSKAGGPQQGSAKH